MKVQSPPEIYDFLEGHNIIIRAIADEEWMLSIEKSLQHNISSKVYPLTEITSRRLSLRNVQPRVYASANLCEVLLALLCDPQHSQENRGTKFCEKYPIPACSNILKIDLLRKRGSHS